MSILIIGYIILSILFLYLDKPDEKTSSESDEEFIKKYNALKKKKRQSLHLEILYN